jgi:hypothetical protein
MTPDDELCKSIEAAIQSQKPVWLGVWIDIEAGAMDVWLNVGNKTEQKENAA